MKSKEKATLRVSRWSIEISRDILAAQYSRRARLRARAHTHKTISTSERSQSASALKKQSRASQVQIEPRIFLRGLSGQNRSARGNRVELHSFMRDRIRCERLGKFVKMVHELLDSSLSLRDLESHYLARARARKISRRDACVPITPG